MISKKSRLPGANAAELTSICRDITTTVPTTKYATATTNAKPTTAATTTATGFRLVSSYFTYIHIPSATNKHTQAATAATTPAATTTTTTATNN